MPENDDSSPDSLGDTSSSDPEPSPAGALPLDTSSDTKSPVLASTGDPLTFFYLVLGVFVLAAATLLLLGRYRYKADQ